MSQDSRAVSRRRSSLALIALLAVLGAMLSVFGSASIAQADGGTASVSGTVTDASTSAPIADVIVNITSEDGSYFDEAVTGSDGTYALLDIPAGSYTLQFQPDEGVNYLLQCWENNACNGNETYFDVADGAVLTGFDAALQPGAAISGTVTNAAGHPIANVDVEASTADGVGDGTTTTDADGNYTVNALPAGNYALDFRPTKGNYLEEWWNNEPTQDSANRVSVAAASTVTGIDAQLATGATITGTVSTADGPLKGATVAAISTVDGQITGREPKTDADGNYKITALPAGSYKVQFSAPKGPNLATQWWSDATSLSSATPVDTSASSPATGIDATLVTGATVSGRIFAPGTPKVGLAGASVALYSVDTGVPFAYGFTNANGRYSIDDLPAGDYTVGITTDYDSGAVAAEWWGGTFIETGSKVLTLTESEAATDINQQLIVGSPISGTVTAGTSGPARADVYVWSSDEKVGSSGNPPFQTTTDDDGNYTLPNLGPGKYTIEFESDDPNFSGQWWNDQPNQAKATRLVVQKDVPVTGIDATLAPVVITPGRPTITGRPRVGETLTAHHGTWNPKGMIFTYQWLQDGQPIAGATEVTYVPTATDQGHALSVAITGTTLAYEEQGISETVTSPVTVPIRPPL